MTSANDSTPDLAPTDAAADTTERAIPDFAFPFSPKRFQKAKDEQPNHWKANPSRHDSRPGPAPRGSRRSMGKR